MDFAFFAPNRCGRLSPLVAPSVCVGVLAIVILVTTVSLATLAVSFPLDGGSLSVAASDNSQVLHLNINGDVNNNNNNQPSESELDSTRIDSSNNNSKPKRRELEAASNAKEEPSQGSKSQEGAAQEDDSAKEQEAVLSEFKCDFGSAEAPELCKIKVFDPSSGQFALLQAPTSVASGSQQPNHLLMSGWSHGSGKLALYQGGPLLDASVDRNDTSGGYIFYETSSAHHPAPFTTANPGSSNNNITVIDTTRNHKVLIEYYAGANGGPSGSQQQAGQPTPLVSSYRRRVDQPSAQRPASNQLQRAQFQRISSASVEVGAAPVQQDAGSHATPHQHGQQHQLMVQPAFSTPNLTAPGPPGMCLSFKYIIRGLSADELNVHVTDGRPAPATSRPIWASAESVSSNWTRGEVLYSATGSHALSFGAASFSRLKDVAQRKFRGYIAVDDIQVAKHDPSVADAACKGHCNFDGDLCGWQNAADNEEDDFDWSFGRGSDNLFTGPSRDYVSSANNEQLTGSFLFTDSGFPRRPGDKAVLVSPVFAATEVNDALCMRIAVHMFGSGIGLLAIKIRYTDDAELSAGNQTATGGAAPPAGAGGSGGSGGTSGQAASGAQPQGSSSGAPAAASSSSSSSSVSSSSSSPSSGFSGERSDVGKNDLVIWEMAGDAGNNWHQAQTSMSSSRSSFQVIIEGVIGDNHLGNIAIDEVSFSSGACPTSPPLASKNYGDCTFEQSMCHWRNPDEEMHLDDLDWIRSTDEQSIHGPNFDHTLRKRNGFYLRLENTFREPKSGTRAFLLSPIFQPKSNQTVQCISFYYYMFMRSVGFAGPNLGTIRVYLASNNELVPIWRLTNPISSPNWKHARASLSAALVDGQPHAPSKLFQIAFEGIWGDAPAGAIAIDDVTVFDGACDILPSEARSVAGECTFDVDTCSWSNKTLEFLQGASQSPAPGASDDPSKSPFLQSVNVGAPKHQSQHQHQHQHQQHQQTPQHNQQQARQRLGWQLATVDARPVNLQDHTYKAPVGYAYFDVFDGSGSSPQPLQAALQAVEVTMASGSEPVFKCLSFWFAAYGRGETNSLSVHMTQATAPPPNSNAESQASGGKPASQSVGSQSSAGKPQDGPPSSDSSPTSGSSTEDGSAGDGAWRLVLGKTLWSLSLRNITETNRRRWQYAQAPIKADSNYIVRFVAASNDGGFALDDISFYDGNCETRPASAKITQADADDDTASKPAAR